jgi:hypothetical protein
MRVALGMLAEKTGLPIATQATVILRQALDRTINSHEGRERLREQQAHQTARDWSDDRSTETFVENVTREAARLINGTTQEDLSAVESTSRRRYT